MPGIGIGNSLAFVPVLFGGSISCVLTCDDSDLDFRSGDTVEFTATLSKEASAVELHDQGGKIADMVDGGDGKTWTYSASSWTVGLRGYFARATVGSSTKDSNTLDAIVRETGNAAAVVTPSAPSADALLLLTESAETIEATITDADGTIASAGLYDGDPFADGWTPDATKLLGALTVKAGNVYELAGGLDVSGLSAGAHTLYFHARDNDFDDTTATVAVDVISEPQLTALPAILLTTRQYTLTCTIASGHAQITGVEFYRDATKIGDGVDQGGGVWTYAWTPGAGELGDSQTIKAVVTNGTDTADSTTDTCSVKTIPTLAISAPAADSLHNVGDDPGVEVTVTDPQSALSGVDVTVYGDANDWGTTTPGSPHTLAYTLQSGDVGDPVAVKASATIPGNSAVESATRDLEINALPTGTIDQASGGTYHEGTEYTITGTWSDVDAESNPTGRLLLGAVELGAITVAGSGTSGTWSYDWTPTSGQGGDSQTLKLELTDDDSQVTASADTITVNVNQKPTASISNPTGNVGLDESVNIDVDVSDPDGTIASVTVTIEGAGPYTCTDQGGGTWRYVWTTPSEATEDIDIVATVTDNDGAVATDSIQIDAIDDETLALLQTAKVWVETDVGGGPSDDYWESGDFTITANADPTPDQFDSITNQGTLGGTFANSGTARPSVAHLPGGGVARRVGLFDGANDCYASSLAASNFTFLHSAAFEFWTVVKCKDLTGVNGTGGSAGGPSETGSSFYFSGTSPRFIVCNGSGTYHASISGGSAVENGAVYVVRCRVTGGSGYLDVYDTSGSIVSTGSVAVTGSPSGAAPSFTWNIGNVRQGSSYFDGNIGAFLAFDSALSSENAALVKAYLLGRYADANFTERLKAAVDGVIYSLADPSYYEIDTGVSRLYDLSGNARDAYQATGSKQPALGTALNGSADFDGSDDYMVISSGLGWSSSTSHHVFFALDPDNATTPRDLLLVNQISVAQVSPTTGLLGAYVGAWQTIGAATTGNQLLEFELDAASGLTTRRGGVDVDTAAYTTPAAFSGVAYLGSNNPGTDHFYDGDSGSLTYCSQVISGAGLTTLRAEINTEAGL